MDGEIPYHVNTRILLGEEGRARVGGVLAHAALTLSAYDGLGLWALYMAELHRCCRAPWSTHSIDGVWTGLKAQTSGIGCHFRIVRAHEADKWHKLLSGKWL